MRQQAMGFKVKIIITDCLNGFGNKLTSWKTHLPAVAVH